LDWPLQGVFDMFFIRLNAAERNGWMGTKDPYCLSPDLSGRVYGTAAASLCEREAEGQVEGCLSFAPFCQADDLALGARLPGPQ